MNAKLARVVFALVLAIGATGYSATSALALPPDFTEISANDTYEEESLCPFLVKITVNVEARQAIHFDSEGNDRRVIIQVKEQDTFEANGKTLVGEPYHYTVIWLVDSNVGVTNIFLTGVASRVRLPDGSLFLTAGRTDALNHPESVFILEPDHGTPVSAEQLDAFCAALGG